MIYKHNRRLFCNQQKSFHTFCIILHKMTQHRFIVGGKMCLYLYFLQNSKKLQFLIKTLYHVLKSIITTSALFIVYLFKMSNWNKYRTCFWWWGKWKRSLTFSWILIQSHWCWVYQTDVLLHLLIGNCIISYLLQPGKIILLNWISDKSTSLIGRHKIIF